MTFRDPEWDRCKPWIEAARIETPFPEPMETIEAKLLSGQYQLWPSDTAAAITRIAHLESGDKAVKITHWGGSLDVPLEKRICEHAKEIGCSAVTFGGRAGWRNIAKKHGYSFGWITMTKELAHA